MPTTPSVVGRDAELHRLRDWLATSSEPTAVFVGGDAGVGKTTLLEAVAGEAANAGARVTWARPTAAETSSSYAALDDLMRPLVGQLPRLADPQRRALAAALLLESPTEPVEPRVVGLACLSLLALSSTPTVLAVDDWQWLDAASNEVLSFVLRRLDPSRAKLVAAVRSGEADEAVATLLGALPAGRGVELALAPLDRKALGQLVHARSGSWFAPPRLRRLHQACLGNPLLALELIRAPSERTATDVRRLLASRVRALSDEARVALRYAAALAQPTTDLVTRAIGDPEKAARGLDEALIADVAVRENERLRFSHPLLAAAIEEYTTPDQWCAIHARLADVVEDPEQRARHLGIAAREPHEAVAAELEAAAMHAGALGAYDSAGELSERAAVLTPSFDAAARARRQLAAADAHVAANDGPRAHRLLRALVDQAQSGTLRAEALHRLALVAGDASGLRLAEQALLEAGNDDVLVSNVRLTLSKLLVQQGELREAVAHAEVAVAHAELAGDPVLLADALTNLAFDRWAGGGGVQRATLERADALERRGSGRARDDTAPRILATQLRVAGEPDEARDLLLAELERAGTRGRVDHEAVVLRELVALEVRAGHWALAEAYADRLHEAAAGAEFFNVDAEVHWAAALVAAHLGRVASAREHARTGRAISRECGDVAWSTRCRQVLGFLELSLADPAAAVEQLSEAYDNERRLGWRDPGVLDIAPDFAEALVLAGDLDRGREVQAELEARGRELDRPALTASSLKCRGLIAATQGQPHAAVTDLTGAVAIQAELPHPFDHARALLALGSVQRRAKQRAEARVSLESALARFHELGAPLWVERARAEISRLGGRHAQDRDELTESERRIAALAAGGRSNREIAAELFVSVRTVESNLTRAYRKLGVRSRTQLARRLP